MVDVYSFDEETVKRKTTHILTVSDSETGDVSHRSEHITKERAQEKMCELKGIMPGSTEKARRRMKALLCAECGVAFEAVAGRKYCDTCKEERDQKTNRDLYTPSP